MCITLSESDEMILLIQQQPSALMATQGNCKLHNHQLHHVLPEASCSTTEQSSQAAAVSDISQLCHAGLLQGQHEELLNCRPQISSCPQSCPQSQSGSGKVPPVVVTNCCHVVEDAQDEVRDEN